MELEAEVAVGDRALAVRVARGALAKLGVSGLHIRDVLVPAVGPTGNQPGEYDLLLNQKWASNLRRSNISTPSRGEPKL